MATRHRNTHFIIGLIAAFIDSLKRAMHSVGAGGSVSGSTGATAPSAAEQALAGTGFTTVGQVVTTTESFTASLNQYAGCWLLSATGTPCFIVSHPAAAGAPLALTVYGAAPATDVGTFKVLRGTNHLHGAGTLASPGSTPAVHHDRAEYTITAANATTAPTLLTLTRAILVAYVTHVRDALAHTAADTTNDPDLAASLQSIVSNVVDTASCITLLNDLKAGYNAHRGESGVHPANDSGNATTASNATDLASAITLANELKADLNAHFADGQLPASWRVTGY